MKIVLIGVKSSKNNISGQSICFDLLLEKLNDLKIPFKQININVDDSDKLKKAFEYLKAAVLLIFLYLKTFKVSKVIYIAIAQSKLGFYRDFLFIWISFFFRKKIVVHLHGGNFKNFYLSQSKFLRGIIKRTYDKCDSIIVLSAIYIDLFDFVDDYKNKVKVVTNGIPEFDAQETIIKNYDKNEPVLLYLSNLIETKGYLDVLKSITILKNKYSINPIVYFCGKFMSNSDDVKFGDITQAESYFQEYINNNDIKKNVVYNGLVYGNEKDEILKKASFLILPSNYNAEGQPISLIEGLKFGCLLITTKYRDLQFMNVEGKTGFFVNYNDPAAIAEAVSKVDESRFQEMSLNAQKHFEENYSFTNHFSKILQILDGYSK